MAETAPQWGASAKIYMRRSIKNWEQYRSAWDLVLEHLNTTDAGTPSDTAVR
ncbi:hypothetical protein [Desertimonas flava]|uniref:hypothetical protein n=1 Tax=Desertimonas flava TaxID=2064846 RepID=UPI0013C4BCC8|nr:hypothetical protein [Desertimonas flava]